MSDIGQEAQNQFLKGKEVASQFTALLKKMTTEGKLESSNVAAAALASGFIYPENVIRTIGEIYGLPAAFTPVAKDLCEVKL